MISKDDDLRRFTENIQRIADDKNMSAAKKFKKAKGALNSIGGEWRDTELFQSIKESETSEARAMVTFLETWMPEISTILARGGTSPTAFTLHDEAHSLRVARRMIEIVPRATFGQLSVYEYTLLLLSAYLHDIGMTPDGDRVNRHYQYLLNGNPASTDVEPNTELSSDELKEFQQWLDDNEREVTVPLTKSDKTDNPLNLARELTTHYCRFRHNEWSELWIRSNLQNEKLGSYSGWIDDLVLLCRSHNEGKRFLLEEAFDPRHVGVGLFVHLRYLACVLRVADILEFDPERTPEVVLRHREIPPESVLYWYKDHGISMVKEGGKISISARPESAQIHRAIETTLEEIDTELSVCRAIADETHFEICAGVSTKLPHKWELLGSVYRDVQPKDDRYEYIDGAFRPNTAKLLELLSGTQLYGTPFAAVRELLQNAFDAVREQIAHEKLGNNSFGVSPEFESALRKTHSVELGCETRKDGTWLVCKDSGVGMTKAIITNHLLVSGQSRRHDILELERRCKAAGFSLGRTGTFGIGVLSYFMISDKVVITTRRRLEAGDADPSGWRFETEGLGSFGSLQKDNSLPGGSRVELRLKSKVLGEPQDFYQSLLEHVIHVVRHVPCTFRTASTFEKCEQLTLAAGWTAPSKEFEKAALEELDNPYRGVPASEKLLPLRAKLKLREAAEHKTKVYSEALGALRWIEKEGKILQGLGRYRIRIPYFDLPGGQSLAYFRASVASEEISVDRVHEGCCAVSSKQVVFSWKGMRISCDDFDIGDRYSMMYARSAGYHIEFDYESDAVGKPSVDRAHIEVSDLAKTASLQVLTTAQEMITNFCAVNKDSAYSSINFRLSGECKTESNEQKWFFDLEQGDGGIWRDVSVPFTTSVHWAYQEKPNSLLLGEKPVDVLICLGKPRDREHYKGISFTGQGIAPQRLVVGSQGWRNIVVPLWTQNPYKNVSANGSPLISTFPPAWRAICGVHFGSYSSVSESGTVWNAKHPLVKAITSDSWSWATNFIYKFPDPLDCRSELLTNRAKAAAWILLTVAGDHADMWEGICERDDKFIREVWKLAFGNPVGAKEDPIFIWVQETDHRLREIAPDRWVARRDTAEIEKVMPNPGGKWTIRFSPR